MTKCAMTSMRRRRETDVSSTIGVTPKWDRHDIEVSRSKWKWHTVGANSKWSRREIKVKTKWCRSEGEMESKWSCSETELKSKWHRSDVDAKSKWHLGEVEGRSGLASQSPPQSLWSGQTRIVSHGFEGHQAWHWPKWIWNQNPTQRIWHRRASRRRGKYTFELEVGNPWQSWSSHYWVASWTMRLLVSSCCWEMAFP